MNIKIVPYEPCHWTGVRNLAIKYNHYPENYDFIWHWSRTIYHSWDYRVEDVFPYPHGIVVLDDNIVVGFFGCMFSIRHTSKGKSYRYLNFTRWILEEEYRRWYFSILCCFLKNADVISDFSASDSVFESFVQIYKFKMIDSLEYRFFPVPYAGLQNVIVRKIVADDIYNQELKQEYMDHIPYNIEAVHCHDNIEDGYIFFQPKGYRIRIVKVTNRHLFGSHLHEILWGIQRARFVNPESVADVAEKILFAIKEEIPILCECDKRFIDADDIFHPLYLKKKIRSLLLNKLNEDVDLDNLYSEISVVYDSREQAEKFCSTQKEIF